MASAACLSVRGPFADLPGGSTLFYQQQFVDLSLQFFPAVRLAHERPGQLDEARTEMLRARTRGVRSPFATRPDGPSATRLPGRPGPARGRFLPHRPGASAPIPRGGSRAWPRHLSARSRSAGGSVCRSGCPATFPPAAGGTGVWTGPAVAPVRPPCAGKRRPSRRAVPGGTGAPSDTRGCPRDPAASATPPGKAGRSIPALPIRRRSGSARCPRTRPGPGSSGPLRCRQSPPACRPGPRSESES